MKRIAIIGLGLMGASLGLAARTRRLGAVRGYARRSETRREALERGAVDEAFGQPEEAVRNADVAVFCTPVLTIPTLIRQCVGSFKSGCVITDVGSTKGFLVEQVTPMLHDTGVAYVGSHPMAGSEQTGIEAARFDLYDGAVVAITPAAAADPAAIRTVAELWTAAGARVVALDAGEHDRIVARTSHLPHLVAAMLVASVGREAEPHLREFCGPGFRDTTRIASGSAEVWHDIVKTNRDALLAELRAYDVGLQDVIRMLEQGDFESVRRLLETIRTRRDELVE